MSLLTEACELEHGLACSYLYSAFTLKQSPFENGLTAHQLQFVRKWAGQLYFIASQEMLHLSQAWNLLTAIGGTPYYMRPNFPQSAKYYPIDLPLLLEPYSKKALKRFTFYELPSHVSDVEFLMKEFHITQERINHAFTVGGLYAQIREAFHSMPADQLFIGDPILQVGSDVCHFNEIVKVIDLESADKAIDTIMEQGEGNNNDQLDCHYGMFRKMDEEFDLLHKEAIEARIDFEPSRNTIHNPITKYQRNVGPKGATLITDPFTSDVAVFFDNVYSLMLRILQYVFSSGALSNRMQSILCDIAIQIMTRGLKPIGETLTLLPAGIGSDDKTAGPSFGLYRHISLPAQYDSAIVVIKERFIELINEGNILTKYIGCPQVLHDGIMKLADISSVLFDDN